MAQIHLRKKKSSASKVEEVNYEFNLNKLLLKHENINFDVNLSIID